MAAVKEGHEVGSNHKLHCILKGLDKSHQRSRGTSARGKGQNGLHQLDEKYQAVHHQPNSQACPPGRFICMKLGLAGGHLRPIIGCQSQFQCPGRKTSKLEAIATKAVEKRQHRRTRTAGPIQPGAKKSFRHP
jgi:hypothetical protein